MSALLHFLLFQTPGTKPQKINPGPTELEFIFPEKPERIVPPSEVQPVKEAPRTNNLSDKNTKTEQETIRKGQPEPSPPVPKPQPRPLTPKPELFPKIKPEVPVPAPEKVTNDVLSRLATPQGAPDLLPEIKEAELTMLNAKASLHAVFVRRVALKVFSQLKREIPGKAPGTVRLRAVMDLEGKLTAVEPLSADTLGGALEFAVNKGFWDLNPPPEALTTNNEFHFVFEATLQRFGARGYSVVLGTGLL